MISNVLRQSIIIPVVLISLGIFAQEAAKPYSGGIIAGSNRTFLISFVHQEPVKGKILSLDGDMLTIKSRNGAIQKVDRNSITNISEIPFGTIGSVGAGFGVPYGILGIGVEFNALPILSLNGGLGTTIFSGVGWNVGARAYFRKPGPVWRPRISAFYGINGVYAEDFGDPDNASYAGLTVGLGQLFLWQQHGFDLDLMYIINSELYDVIPGDYVRFKINVGYRFAF